MQRWEEDYYHMKNSTTFRTGMFLLGAALKWILLGVDRDLHSVSFEALAKRSFELEDPGPGQGQIGGRDTSPGFRSRQMKLRFSSERVLGRCSTNYDEQSTVLRVDGLP
jgi:hypothetical protein